MELNCKKCGNTWDYKGGSKFYATCPNCMFKVNISKRRVEVLSDE
jgi:hypothetical protein